MKVCPHCRTHYGPETNVCPNDGARLDAPDPKSDALIGTVLAERYRVVRTLGEGGMGRVYLAEHVRMGRMSAVKVMSPALAPTADAISRFNREAANASRINHPNVAAIYDFGETEDGTLYLAMEYVDGETLSAFVHRTGSVPLPLVGELTKQIGDALNAAHQFGIIHRDLKPDNILVARDPEGRYLVKVVDFGIAKTMQGGGQTVTSVGVSIGTPEYMSPEQLAGDTLDARTDIYSLGLVVYTMLTGETPFPGLTSKQSLVERLTARPRALKEVRPAITWPDRLQSALDRALSPEPDDRYRKVSDFALDIVAATSGPSAVAQAATRAMTPLVVAAIPAPAPVTIAPVTPPVGSRRRRVPLLVGALVVLGAAAYMFREAPKNLRAPPAAKKQQAVKLDSTPPATTPKVGAPAPRKPAGTPIGSAAVATLPRAIPVKRAADSPRALASSPSEARVVPAISAPVIPPLDEPPLRRNRAGLHAWLGANGDSASQQANINPLIAEAREVMGHVNRTRKLFAMNQPARALPELRTAYEEYLMFAAEHPGTRQTTMLRNQLKAVTDTALAGCPVRSDSTVRRDMHDAMCASLAKAAALAEQNGRMDSNAFQQNRRKQRRQLAPEP